MTLVGRFTINKDEFRRKMELLSDEELVDYISSVSYWSMFSRANEDSNWIWKLQICKEESNRRNNPYLYELGIIANERDQLRADNNMLTAQLEDKFEYDYEPIRFDFINRWKNRIFGRKKDVDQTV